MLGVVKEVEPLVETVPPVEAAYQSMVSPDPGVALNETVPPVPQREPAVPVGADGTAFTVVAVEDVADDAIHPLVFVYFIVTVLEPVVSHFKVTVLSVVPTPPELIE
jgi:hypothetical protein